MARDAVRLGAQLRLARGPRGDTSKQYNRSQNPPCLKYQTGLKPTDMWDLLIEICTGVVMIVLGLLFAFLASNVSLFFHSSAAALFLLS
jgi:hypothetical protein